MNTISVLPRGLYGVMRREVHRQLNGTVRGRWLKKFTGTVFTKILGKPDGPCHTGADKSLARPGRRQANVSVRMA